MIKNYFPGGGRDGTGLRVVAREVVPRVGTAGGCPRAVVLRVVTGGLVGGPGL